MFRLPKGGLLILSALFAVHCLAQDNAKQDNANQPATTLHTTARLVVVPTLVETPANEIVYSLNDTDFILTDNGVPQKVQIESAATQPLRLVVLVQTGGAAVHELNKYAHVETMLAALLGGPPNQISIVNFDSKPEAASPFTSDIAQWTDAINHPDPGDSGAAIFDALKFSLNRLDHEQQQSRRAILLISQPYDVGSKTTPKEILRIAAETNTEIYSLTFSPEKTTIKDSLKENPHDNPPIQVGNGSYVAYFNLSEPFGLIIDSMRKNAAAELATVACGEAANFDSANQLDDRLATFSNHLHNRYLLTFVPTSPRAGIHSIQVRVVNHPEFLVLARSGYWLSLGDQSH
jgi:VWFA-related protein